MLSINGSELDFEEYGSEFDDITGLLIEDTTPLDTGSQQCDDQAADVCKVNEEKEDGTGKISTMAGEEEDSNNSEMDESMDIHEEIANEVDGEVEKGGKVKRAENVKEQREKEETIVGEQMDVDDDDDHSVTGTPNNSQKDIESPESPQSTRNGHENSGKSSKDEQVDDDEMEEDCLELFGEDNFMSDLLVGVSEDVEIAKNPIIRKMRPNKSPIANHSPDKDAGKQQTVKFIRTLTGKPAVNNRVSVKNRLGIRQPLDQSNQQKAKQDILKPGVEKQTYNMDTIDQSKVRVVKRQLNNTSRAPPKPSTSSIQSLSIEDIHAFALKNIITMPFSAPIQPESIDLLMPSFTVTDIHNEIFTFIFGPVCRRFMYEKCLNNPNNCSLEHRLPDKDTFNAKLNKVSPPIVTELYDVFILRNKHIFNEYFTSFAEYFGKHRLEEKLIQMVTDCVQRNSQRNFRRILDGFGHMDVPYTIALKKLVRAINRPSMLTCNSLVLTIFDTRNREIQPFLEILEKLSKNREFVFPADTVNRMLRIFVANRSDKMRCILHNLLVVRKFHHSTIDKELLVSFHKIAAEQQKSNGGNNTNC